MRYTDDPLKDFAMHDLDVAEYEASRPHCYNCDEPILDDYAVEIDGNLYCEECIKSMRKWID